MISPEDKRMITEAASEAYKILRKLPTPLHAIKTISSLYITFVADTDQLVSIDSIRRDMAAITEEIIKAYKEKLQ